MNRFACSLQVLKPIGFGLILFGLQSCAPLAGSVPYQRAHAATFAGWQGYLDKEIAPGRYIIEVSQVGGYVHNMEVLKSHWLRRANELCPHGYTGSYQVILPMNARLDEFRCDLVYCQRYPMVSGVIQCKR